MRLYTNFGAAAAAPRTFPQVGFIATSLNVRQQPTTQSPVVDILDQGRKLIVSTRPDADGWVAIRTGDVEGYVKEEYLR